MVVYKETKHLLATLLLHEIIWKREASINQLMQGLSLLNVLETLRKFPSKFRGKFVMSNVKLTSTELLEQTTIATPSSNDEERAKMFFLQYVQDNKIIKCGNGNFFFICVLTCTPPTRRVRRVQAETLLSTSAKHSNI